MLTCDTLHNIHKQLIVIIGKISLFVNWSYLKLIGSHLIMTSFHGDTEQIGLPFEFFHIGNHPFGDRAKIVVFQLLILT